MKVVLLAGGYLALAYERGEYNDVAPTDWYAPYVTGAVQAGLMNGLGRFQAIPPPRFNGNQPVTRLEAALVIGNLLISKGAMNYILVPD